MKRRTFLLSGLGAAGALLVGWGLLPPRTRMGLPRIAAQGAAWLNGWVKVYLDGRVGVVVPRAEMGQGVHTALPMLVAEELGVAMAQVQVEPAGFDAIYGNVALFLDALPVHPDARNSLHHHPVLRLSQWFSGKVARELGLQITGGSTSVRDAWVPLRQAGALARELLLAAAAQQWGTKREYCRLVDGQAIHSDGRRLGIGALAQAALKVHPPQTIALKPASEFKLLGTPVPRLDVAAKVNGSARFGLDVRLPQMLFAAVRFCPVLGGTVASFNGDAVRQRPGVVRVSSFAGGAGAAAGVAVVAQDSWTALSGVEQVEVKWREGDSAELSSAQLLSAMREQLDHFDGHIFFESGQGAEALQGATRVLSADYSAPFLAHATLEPMNCTAQFLDDGHLRLWVPTQVASIAREVAARVAGIDVDRVQLEVTLLGGGFGRRLESDFVAVAVQVARDVAPRPVQVLWSRQTDMAHDLYRPAAVARMQAGLNAEHQPIVWAARSISDAISPQYMRRAYPQWAVDGWDAPDKTAAEGLFDQAYEFEHRLIAHQRFPSAVPIGYWRSVGHSLNAFFTESFMDEVAHAVGTDPLEFRLRLLREHPRHRAVLVLAAQEAHWGDALAPGRARGLALHESFGSIVAQVAEVSIEDQAIKVHRVVCALDCGVAVNPNIIEQQMQGGIVFGLTAALFGEISIEKGRIVQQDFLDYPMAMLRHSPQVDTYIVGSKAPPGGVGEPAVPPVAPAIANAVFALTGKRLRHLPLRL